MFCKYCGKEIDEDSKFCKHCGKRFEEEIKEEFDEEIKEEIEEIEEKGGCLILLLIPIIIIAVVGSLLFIAYKLDSNSDSNGNFIDKILERDITEEDYEIEVKEGLTTITFKVTPNININQYSINLKVYNYKNEIVYEEILTQTDLIKDSTYTFKFDIGIETTLTGTKYYYKVKGKCIN